MGKPNDVRPRLDDVDRRILQVLASEGRIPNNALAEKIGLAPSTCLVRLRSLIEQGVIRGFHADIAPESLGHEIQAVIAVRLQAHARGSIALFAQHASRMTGVRNVFFVAGKYDFLIHVVASTTAELRDFVVSNLSDDPAVASTETNLIFEHIRCNSL
jgi:DNA-binding Lrp family transcriptional regulator